MKIREILNESRFKIDEKTYQQELMWDNIGDFGVVDPTMYLYQELAKITNNFQVNALDVFDNTQIYHYGQKLKLDLQRSQNLPFSQTIKILKYLISYFSTTTYPE